MEEPGGLQSMALQRVRQDLATERQQHYAVVRSPVYSPRVSGFFVLHTIADEEPKAVSIPLLPFANKKRSVSNTLTWTWDMYRNHLEIDF